MNANERGFTRKVKAVLMPRLKFSPRDNYIIMYADSDSEPALDVEFGKELAEWLVAAINEKIEGRMESTKPRLFMDGDQWCLLAGENLRQGVAGFGPTPGQAYNDFCQNLYREIVTRWSDLFEATA